MAALRSTQLVQGSVNTTVPTVVYTTPAGKRTILKFVLALNTTGVARDLQLRLNAIGTIWHKNLSAYGAAGDQVLESFWIVLNPGDQLKLSTVVAGQIDYVLSGSEHTI